MGLFIVINAIAIIVYSVLIVKWFIYKKQKKGKHWYSYTFADIVFENWFTVFMVIADGVYLLFILSYVAEQIIF